MVDKLKLLREPAANGGVSKGILTCCNQLWKMKPEIHTYLPRVFHKGANHTANTWISWIINNDKKITMSAVRPFMRGGEHFSSL
jgi:hypothetical protein